jgi:hypothetical protein
MCGLFGMMLKPDCSISAAQRGVLTYVLSDTNDTRGKDSWGFAAVNEDGGILVRHGLGYLSPKTSELLPYDRFMAHTRWATQGKKTLGNAHPFMIGRIIGAHNGSLWNHDDLNKKYGRKCSVDSMHLVHHLDESRDFGDIEGYGVLEWFEDNDSSCVYLCMMTDRSDLCVVAIGDDKNIEGVIWSSDDDHLVQALEAAGVKKWFKYKIDSEQVYYARPDGLFFVPNRKIVLDDSFGYTYKGNKNGNSRWSSYSSNYGATDRKGNYFSRPSGLTDKEWNEWKEVYLQGEDDDVDNDVDVEIRALNCQLTQRLEAIDDEEGEVSVEIVIDSTVPRLDATRRLATSYTEELAKQKEEEESKQLAALQYFRGERVI